MGLGGTAKKVQRMVDLAEKLHARIMDIKERVEGTQETVDETADRVDAIESELGEQREILEAIAESQGVDLDEIGDTDAVSATVGDGAGGDGNA